MKNVGETNRQGEWASVGERETRPTVERREEKLCRVPDVRVDEKSAAERAQAARAIDEGAPALPALSPPRGGAVSLRRGREPKLTDIPLGRAPDVGTPAKPQGVVDHELLRLCEAAKVPAKDRQEIAAFCAKNGVRTDLLRTLVRDGHYQGAQLVHALKTGAILIHAGQQSLVDSEQRLLFKRWVFDYGLMAGKLRFEAVRREGSHAAYNWEKNRVLVSGDGIDLGQMKERGYVIHEMQHVLQDALKATGDTYKFEKEGHVAFAEYMLRSSQVLSENEDGTLEIDLDQALAFWSTIEAFDPPDKFLMKTRILDALEAAERGEPGFRASAGAPALAEALRALDRPAGSFDSVFWRDASNSRKFRMDFEAKRLRTDAEVEARLRTVITKDGLDEPISKDQKR